MKKINFAEPFLDKSEKKYINQAINSKWISKGLFVEKFEKKFSNSLKSKFSVSTNNGTNAFLLILLTLQLKRGDEIIVPSMCYISPIHMIKILGLIPVPVDVDINSFQMDSKLIEKKINSKTKAILVIHNFGGISDIENIENIAKKKKLHLIEDVSETLLSKYKNQYVGITKKENNSKISFSSLHATKTITTGEGGIIFTNNKIIYKNLKKIRDHGIKDSSKYIFDKVGGNFRLSNLLCSIGYAQLLKAQEIKKRKIYIDKFYKKEFKNLKSVKIQYEPKESKLIKWGFPIKLKNKIKANLVKRKLNYNSIVCRPCFRSLDTMRHINLSKNHRSFFNARFLQDRILILPMHSNLKLKDLKFIVKTVKKYG